MQDHKKLRPHLLDKRPESLYTSSYLSGDNAPAGIGTILKAKLLKVAGFHRASPSTALDKR